MSRSNLITKFLNELNSDEVKSAMGHLNEILDLLENKSDPDPIEMEIVNEAYQTLEKLQILEAAIRRYLNEDNTLMGDKLDDLYGSGHISGTSTLFR